MLDWYELWTLCVLVLWAVASPRDRNALRIVLIASLAAEVVVEVFTRQIQAPWKMVIPGALDTLSIMALFHFSKNRSGHLQIGALCVSWITNLLCYMDVINQNRNGFFYSNYETIFQVVAVAQLAACYDTLVYNAVRVYRWLDDTGPDRSRHIPAASLCPDVLHSASDKGI